MLNFEGFTILILFFILAPIIGAITLLFIFIFEERIDLLENQNKKIALEKELHKAQYNQLNQQIQPHFLFNALNVILSLARLKRSEELVKALEHLSLFLKFKYKTIESLVPIEQEFQYIQHYIEIQKIRFGERLTVNMKCPQELLRASIPPFVLQTLVENAFKHGLESKRDEVMLGIQFFLQNDYIVLQVMDNGSGMDKDYTVHLETSGHGLENIKQRLFLLFGTHANLHLFFDEMKGTKVEVRWPFILDLKNM